MSDCDVAAELLRLQMCALHLEKEIARLQQEMEALKILRKKAIRTEKSQIDGAGRLH